MTPRILPLVILLLLGAAACPASVPQDAASSPDSEDGAATVSVLDPTDNTHLLKGPLSEDGLQAILGTSDISVGEHRIGIVLTSSEGLVRAPAAVVSSFFFPAEGSEGELKETSLAVFRPWPLGTRGLYSTRLTFDAPGRWSIEISVLDPNAPARKAQLFLDVPETTTAPDEGVLALKTKSKTVLDVEGISQLTTGSLHDPDLYQMTIGNAVESGLPTVVVMASPAFCTNAVCGPQVDVLKELKDRYKGRANFIHVDIYDNPDEIQGDLSRARVSPTVIEWRLPSAEWSFVIDADGVISARFESFATLEELEEALNRVLQRVGES